MSRFGGEDDISSYSSEELERYVERRLESVLSIDTKVYMPASAVWHVERALEACHRWRHLGSQPTLFDPASVAHRALHAVDPVER